MAAPTQEIVRTAHGRDLALDIFTPGANANKVAILLLHGGAWRFGSRADMAPFGETLAARGFVAIAAEYRLLGEAPWPAQIDDVMAVIEWTAQHEAKLGLRPNCIVLQGFSAGGHLALLAAARATGIGAVIAFFAPPSLVKPAGAPGPDPAEMLLGPGASVEAALAASPIGHIAPGFPPTFLLSGVDDPLVPPQATLALFETLRANNIPTELHLYSGHTHEFARLPSMLGPVQDEVTLFLQRNVIDPERYRQENLELNMFARPGGPK